MTTATAEAPPAGGKIIRLPAVADRTGKAKSTIYAEVKAGTFPKPRRIGKRAVGWWEHEIDAFNLSRPVADDPRNEERAGGGKPGALKEARNVQSDPIRSKKVPNT